jgi:uncharacterized tellurite resistance protein B-like protein
MPILTLLDRVRNQMALAPHPIRAKSETLCQNYLIGLAMQAHSDGTLTDTERAHFLEMAEIFEIGQTEALALLADAARPSETTIERINASMGDSKYKYYFILDLQIMAHQDFVVKPVESEVIKRFGDILGVTAEDRSFLVSLADAVATNDQAAKEAWLRNFHEIKSKRTALPDDFSHYTV